jgi:hypothetical protein
MATDSMRNTAATLMQTVEIPAYDAHDGHHSTAVTLIWECPRCGGPRGEVFRTISYDGSRRLACGGGKTPAGTSTPIEPCAAKPASPKPTLHPTGRPPAMTTTKTHPTNAASAVLPADISSAEIAHVDDVGAQGDVFVSVTRTRRARTPLTEPVDIIDAQFGGNPHTLTPEGECSGTQNLSTDSSSAFSLSHLALSRICSTPRAPTAADRPRHLPDRPPTRSPRRLAHGRRLMPDHTEQPLTPELINQDTRHRSAMAILGHLNHPPGNTGGGVAARNGVPKTLPTGQGVPPPSKNRRFHADRKSSCSRCFRWWREFCADVRVHSNGIGENRTRRRREMGAGRLI